MSSEFLGIYLPPPSPLATSSRHLTGGPPGFISNGKRRQSRRSKAAAVASESDSDSVTVLSLSQYRNSPSRSPFEPLPAPLAGLGNKLEEMVPEREKQTIELGGIREEWTLGGVGIASKSAAEDVDEKSDGLESAVVAELLRVEPADPVASVETGELQESLPTPSTTSSAVPAWRAPSSSSSAPRHSSRASAVEPTPVEAPLPTKSLRIRLSAASTASRQLPPVASTSTFRHPSPPSSPTTLRVILKVPPRMRNARDSTWLAPPAPDFEPRRDRSRPVYPATTCHHDKNRTCRPKMKCVNAPTCAALWCDRCIEKHYSAIGHPPFVHNASFLCPFCRNVCTCARCRRVRTGGPDYVRKPRAVETTCETLPKQRKKRERRIRRPYVGDDDEPEYDLNEDGRIVTFLLSRRRDSVETGEREMGGDDYGSGSDLDEDDSDDDDWANDRRLSLPALDDLPISMPGKAPTIWNEGPKRKRRRTLGDDSDQEDEEMSAEAEAEVKAVFEELIIDRTTDATSPLLFPSPDTLFEDLPPFDPLLGSFADFDPIPPFHSPQLVPVGDDGTLVELDEAMESLPIPTASQMLEEQPSLEFYPAGHLFDPIPTPIYTLSPPCQLPTPDMFSAPGSPVATTTTLFDPTPRDCPPAIATAAHYYPVTLLPSSVHDTTTPTPSTPLPKGRPGPKDSTKNTGTFDHPEAVSSMMEKNGTQSLKQTTSETPRALQHSPSNAQAPTPAASPRAISPTFSPPRESKRNATTPRSARSTKVTDVELGSALRKAFEKEGGGNQQASPIHGTRFAMRRSLPSSSKE